MSTGRPPEEAEQAWRLRYIDPDRSQALTGDLEPGAYRDVLEAFAHWRARRTDEALARIVGAQASGLLESVWLARAMNINAALLAELKLFPETLRLSLQELDVARDCGNVMAIASAVHDIGVSYEFSDPGRSRDQLANAMRLARDVRTEDSPEGAEASALEALAATNLRELGARFDLDLPTDIPDVEEAERLAEAGWPSLGASLRAVRARALLDEGRDAEAATLVARLPDPTELADPSNSAYIDSALAAYQVTIGRGEDAVRRLQAAIERVPEHERPELLGQLAETLAARGEYAEAYRTSQRQVEATHRLHLHNAAVQVRTLEVWHRTRAAETEAQDARALAVSLRRLADRDPLTGMWNRRYLDEAVAALDPAPGHQVAVIDADRFKAINDTLGHTQGDRTLQRIARALLDATRDGDLCIRHGGDEFVVIRPAVVGGDLAADLVEVTRLDVRRRNDPETGGIGVLTTSIGVAAFGTGTYAQALSAADERMYAAKRAGGGRLVAG